MPIPRLESISVIEQRYRTGEEPVSVMCSDGHSYICKYMRSSSAAYKLVCELVGSIMAKSWQLETPDLAFVNIRHGHWSGYPVQHILSAPSLGSRRLECVIDVTPSTFSYVKTGTAILKQLLKIALFDFWIANEDRNSNNANLLYDVARERLVSIDYGCILNTSTFDFPMSQLTITDTILGSDLFHHLVRKEKRGTVIDASTDLLSSYNMTLRQCHSQIRYILEELPKEWNVAIPVVEGKLNQLFESGWETSVQENFIECLKDNLPNG